VLINNSGVTWGGKYDDFDEEKGWDNVFGVNVKSIFFVSFPFLSFPRLELLLLILSKQ